MNAPTALLTAAAIAPTVTTIGPSPTSLAPKELMGTVTLTLGLALFCNARLLIKVTVPLICSGKSARFFNEVVGDVDLARPFLCDLSHTVWKPFGR
jgi:hypothetical protein